MEQTYGLEAFRELNITAKKGFDDKDVRKIGKKYYDGKAGEVNKEIWEKNFDELASGVQKGYSTVNNSQDVRLNYELKNNVATFAAFKSFQMGKDVSKILVDEKGNKRGFHAFMKEYHKVNGAYNNQYLSAEYQIAQRQAQSARQFQDFLRDKDVFPNLEYMPSRASEPRSTHQDYYGVIKPVEDPFWDEALPPSDWGCKCWVKQTGGIATSEDIPTHAPPKGIVGNPAKTGLIFNPQHPYVQSANKSEKQVVKEAFDQLKPAMENNPVIYHGKKGKVEVSLNADPVDYIESFSFLEPFSNSYKTNGRVVSISKQKGDKNPDLEYGSRIGDLRTWKKAKDGRNFINGAFNKKYGKKGQLRDFENSFMGLDFNNKLKSESVANIVIQLNGKFDRYPNCKFILLKNGEKVTRIYNKRFTIQGTITQIKKELL